MSAYQIAVCGLIEGLKLPHQYEADGLIAAAVKLEMTGCCNKVNAIAPDLSLESTFKSGPAWPGPDTDGNQC